MPREIVLGNQCMLVNIDKYLQVRDLFYPHVGEENHVHGQAHKIGVFVEGRFSWISDSGWERSIDYDKDTLVSHAVAENKDLGVSLNIHDCVANEKNVYLKKVSVKNYADRKREIKIFFYQDFRIYGTDFGDTAGYDAHRNALFHYKKNRYFFINCIFDENCASCEQKGDLSEFAVGQTGSSTNEGMWKDAEDGILSRNPIAQGVVDSSMGLTLDLEADSEKAMYYWIAAGKNRDEVISLNEEMMTLHPEKVFENTKSYWKGIVNSRERDFKDLPEHAVDIYKRSVLIVISQIDKGGAITAANDTDNMKFNRDTYSYCWPRDGALVAYGLDRAGFYEYSKPFFEFCSKIISKHGCFLHKYNPDGSLGSTWHPWVKNGEPHLPIQEDETALVVWSLWKHYEMAGDKEFAREMYDKIVVPAADFMCRRKLENGLPEECYDLWEEKEGVFTFTVATVIGGLEAAALFAKEFKDKEREKSYRKAAMEVRDAFMKYLWDEGSNMFLKKVNFVDGEVVKEAVPESSTYGVFAFGVLPADDLHVVANMEKVREELWIDNMIGGLARYKNDYYHRVSHEVPGNPWLITTMWLGKWLIAKAKNLDDLEEGRKIIEWVCYRATSSGMLPEQVHPFTGEPLSVSPLTWSHATFLDMVNDYIDRHDELENNK